MQGSNHDLGVATKVCLVGVCSLAISSTGIMLRKAEHNNEILFNPVAASFISEVMKITVGIILCFQHPRKSLKELQVMTSNDVLLFFVPAFIYVLTNNVRYFIIRAVNPGLVGVLWNLKIVVVALLYQCPPFRRGLSRRQWAGAGLLVIGSVVAHSSQGSSMASDGGSNSGGLLGVMLVLGGVTLAASAGVSCEYAFKATSSHLSFPVQCSTLYAAGGILNFAVLLGQVLVFPELERRMGVGDGGDEPEGSHGPDKSAAAPKVGARFDLFRGFDAWAWAAVANLSLVGFLIGVIFKYIDTVAQVFSDVTAMFLTAFLAWAFFDLNTNPQFFFALLICSSSMVVYYGACEKPSPAPELRQSGEEDDTEVQLRPLMEAIDDEGESDEEEEDAREIAVAVSAEYGEFESDEDAETKGDNP